MYDTRAAMSLLESVYPQGGISGDLFNAGPPWLMMAIRSASLILLSVSPSVNGCGLTERLSMFETRCGVDSGSWQRTQYSALSWAPTVCWYPSATSSIIRVMFFPDASRVRAVILYRPACCPSATALVTCPLESVSAAAGVKLTPDGPLKYTAAPATALPEASFTWTTTG